MTPGKSDTQVIGEQHLLDQQLEVRNNNRWLLNNAENQEKLKPSLQGQDGKNAKSSCTKQVSHLATRARKKAWDIQVHGDFDGGLIIEKIGLNQVTEPGKLQKMYRQMVTDDLPETS